MLIYVNMLIYVHPPTIPKPCIFRGEGPERGVHHSFYGYDHPKTLELVQCLQGGHGSFPFFLTTRNPDL